MKRSRYTVTTQRPVLGVEREVILAYGPQGAREHFEGRGRVVLKVAKGDYRCVPKGNVIVNSALCEAIDLLDIKWPVRVKQTGRAGGRQGAHTLGYDLVHCITIKSWLTPREAGRTLWHELAHAMQAEREARNAGVTRPSDVVQVWNSCSARDGAYRKRPIEVEARSFESWNDDLPLVR